MPYGTLLNTMFPEPAVWSLAGLRFGDIDEQGCEWLVTGESGWQDGPSPRTARTERPRDGSFRGEAFASERIITLDGVTACPSPAARRAAQRSLRALAIGVEHALRRVEDDEDLTAGVEIDAKAAATPLSDTVFTWSLQLAAPDPRLYAPWQSASTGMAAPGTGGINSSAPGINSSPPGIDAGTPGSTGVARANNAGTAPVSPLLTLTGPLTRPTVVHAETGAALTYSGTLAANESLVINCDVFPQRGYPGREVLLGGTARRRDLLTRDGPWPEIPAQGTAGFSLSAQGIDSRASLLVEWRPAYY